MERTLDYTQLLARLLEGVNTNFEESFVSPATEQENNTTHAGRETHYESDGTQEIARFLIITNREVPLEENRRSGMAPSLGPK
jgi:hypothetical protein